VFTAVDSSLKPAVAEIATMLRDCAVEFSLPAGARGNGLAAVEAAHR